MFGLSPGDLPGGAFIVGNAADGPEARLIFNPAKRTLWFDSDGDGLHAAVAVAIFSGRRSASHG